MEMIAQYINVDKITGENVLHLYSDFEETVTLPYEKQEKTFNMVISDSIKSKKEREKFTCEFNTIRNEINKLLENGIVSEELYRRKHELLIKYMTDENIEEASEKWILNENFVKTLTGLKESLMVDKIKISIVARGIQEPFELFFKRNDIKQQLSHLIKIDESGNLDIDVKGYIIDKQKYIPKGAIYLGDYRDSTYNLNYLIDVNNDASNLKELFKKWNVDTKM